MLLHKGEPGVADHSNAVSPTGVSAAGNACLRLRPPAPGRVIKKERAPHQRASEPQRASSPPMFPRPVQIRMTPQRELESMYWPGVSAGPR